MTCPATQEAVIERELYGEMGCPICGRTAEDHQAEVGAEAQRVASAYSEPRPGVGATDDEPTARQPLRGQQRGEPT